jgi:predicted secreted Zn-dependent protease
MYRPADNLKMPWLLALTSLLTLAMLACSNVQARESAGPIEATPGLTGALFDTGVPVELHETMRVDTYAVRGRTAAEIRADLNRNGPISIAEGRRFDALTTWTLRWTLRYDRRGGGCALAGANVYLDVVVLLPELEADESRPPRLLATWQAYREALAAHEMTHYEQQRRGAQELQNALTTFNGVWPSCRELASQLKVTGDEEVAAIFAADRKFDELTEHGRLRGAVFP